jgi:hypothetical protein
MPPEWRRDGTSKIPKGGTQMSDLSLTDLGPGNNATWLEYVQQHTGSDRGAIEWIRNGGMVLFGVDDHQNNPEAPRTVERLRCFLKFEGINELDFVISEDTGAWAILVRAHKIDTLKLAVWCSHALSADALPGLLFLPALVDVAGLETRTETLAEAERILSVMRQVESEP